MDHQQIAEADIIDRYLIENLHPELEAEFEAHFLACPECIAELESSRQTVSLLREAHAGRYVASGQKHPKPRRDFWIPLPALGMALALGAIAIFISANRMPQAPNGQTVTPGRPLPVASQPSLTVVQLESNRSGEGPTQAISAAAAAQAFRLRLYLRGVPAYEQYSMRIVSDSGELVWSREGIENRQADWLEAPVNGAHLEPGVYWVRLFGLLTGTEPVLLREYALTVGR
jgi:hypothetical protein